MSSPDLAAAQYAEDAPTWKGKSLPPVGAGIKIQWLSTGDGTTKTRTEFGTVLFEPHLVSGANLAIPLRAPNAMGASGECEIVLYGNCLIDNWTQITSPESEALPEPSFEPAEETENVTAPEADPATLTGMLRRYLYVDRQITEAEALVKTLKAEKATLNDEIVDECVAQGFTKPPGVGDFTFSFKPTYFTAYLENEDGEKYGTVDVVEALKATGLDVGIVGESYNGNTLKAMLRERKDAGLDLPDELAAVIKLDSKSTVSVTRSAARNRRGRPAAIDAD